MYDSIPAFMIHHVLAISKNGTLFNEENWLGNGEGALCQLP
jgi:hypothetical protein